MIDDRPPDARPAKDPLAPRAPVRPDDQPAVRAQAARAAPAVWVVLVEDHELGRRGAGARVAKGEADRLVSLGQARLASAADLALLGLETPR